MLGRPANIVLGALVGLEKWWFADIHILNMRYSNVDAGTLNVNLGTLKVNIGTLALIKEKIWMMAKL